MTPLLKQLSERRTWLSAGRFLMFVMLVVIPPWLVLEIADVPAFTLLRLLIPTGWIVYLVAGTLMVDLKEASTRELLRLAAWPVSALSDLARSKS